MAIVRHKPDPARPASADRARLDAMTPGEIARNAADDPDNPPLTDKELAIMVAARAVRLARAATGLSQTQFARTFRINPARLRDWEQGRSKPDTAAAAYLTVIRKAPKAVQKALAGEDAA